MAQDDSKQARRRRWAAPPSERAAFILQFCTPCRHSGVLFVLSADGRIKDRIACIVCRGTGRVWAPDSEI